jgi:hypothetical protein
VAFYDAGARQLPGIRMMPDRIIGQTLNSLSARSSGDPGEPARHQQLPKLSNDSGVEVLLSNPQIGDHGHSREDAADGVHGRAVADEADFGSG